MTPRACPDNQRVKLLGAFLLPLCSMHPIAGFPDPQYFSISSGLAENSLVSMLR